MKSKLIIRFTLVFLVLLSCTKQIDDSILDVDIEELLVEVDPILSTENTISSVGDVYLNGDVVESFDYEIMESDQFIRIVLPSGSNVSSVSIDFTMAENASLASSISGLNFTGTGIKLISVVAENGDTRTYALKIIVTGGVDPMPSPYEIISVTSVTASGIVVIPVEPAMFSDNSINVLLPAGTPLTDISFEFEITENSFLLDDATNLSFESGATNEVRLESEEGEVRIYTITVELENTPDLSDKNEIIKITATIGDAPNTTIIYEREAPEFDGSNSIIMEVPFKTMIDDVDLEFELSEFATLQIDDITTGLDFTGGVVKMFTVIAQDGSGSDQPYGIEVVVADPTEREALIEMYAGDNSVDDENKWDLSEDSDIGLWEGVQTNENGNVIGLSSEPDNQPLILNRYLQYLPFLQSIVSNDGGMPLPSDEEMTGVILPNLESIEYTDGANPNLGSWLANQPNLKEIHLSQSDGIPNNIGDYLALERLLIDDRTTITVPDSLSNVETLIEIILTRSEILEIPESLAELPNLTLLNIGGGGLTSIPQAICDWGEIDGHTLIKDDAAVCDEDTGITEREALINMYDVSSGIWDLTQEDISGWAGLEFNAAGSVTGFNFDSDISPIKTFDENLQYLPNLQIIGVYDNSVDFASDTEVQDIVIPNLAELRFESISGGLEIPNWIKNQSSLSSVLLSDLNQEAIEQIVDIVSLNTLIIQIINFEQLPESFSNLLNLTSLTIGENTLISEIPIEIYELSSLETLNIIGDGGNGGLITVDSSIIDLPRLTSLNISGNENLTSIPQAICDWGEEAGNTLLKDDTTLCDGMTSSINAQKLALLAMYNGDSDAMWDIDTDLSTWGGVTVDPTTGNVIGLTFDPDFSPITNFNSSLGDLTYLTSISAADSTLRFSQDVTLTNNLDNLTSISIDTDSFSTFPNWIFTLPNLTTLRLDNLEGLNEIPSELGSIESLTVINIVNGYVTSFPQSIVSLPNLIGLNISNQNDEILVISDAFCQRNDTDDDFTLTLSDNVICDGNTSDNNYLTSLYLSDANGTQYTADLADIENIAITIEVPFSTDITNLETVFAFDSTAISSVNSPVTHNFESPLVIEITAENLDQREYTISITRAAMTQREALLSMYDESLDTNNEWDVDGDWNDWRGVTIVGENVTEIRFPDDRYISLNQNLGQLPYLINILLDSVDLPSNINGNLNFLNRISLERNSGFVPEWVSSTQSLTSLSFFDCNAQIPATLSNLENLTSLSLELTNTDVIDDNITSIKTLKFLLFADAGIEIIPDSIDQLENLETLRFTDNDLVNVSNNITNLENLLSLSLSGNDGSLTSLSKEICDFGATLDSFIIDNEAICEGNISEKQALFNMYQLYGGRISNTADEWNLDDDITDWQGVTTEIINGEVHVTGLSMDFGFQPILTLDENLNYLPYFKEIRAVDTSFTFPDTFEEYDVENSNIETIFLEMVSFNFPQWIINLPKLKFLYLDDSFGAAVGIPNNIGDLPVIEELTFRLAGLDNTSIPSSISNLNNTLKNLILIDNNFTAIPDEVLGLSNLESLIMWQNFITEIPETLIEDLPNLNTLDVSQQDGNLTSIPKEICDWGEETGNTLIKSTSTTCQTYPAEIQAQRDALLSMYRDNNDVVWSEDTDMSEWRGVELDTNGNVIGLSFDSPEPSPLILNDSLGDLVYLRSISTQDGGFSFTDVTLASPNPLVNFISISIEADNVSIPDWVISLPNLQNITILLSTVSDEDLEGIASIQSLNRIKLEEVTFRGDLFNEITIPESIGNLSNLTTLIIEGSSNPIIIPKNICDRNDDDASFTLTIDESVSCALYSPEVQAQRDALLSMGQSESNWLETTSMDGWNGVSLDVNGNVIGINVVGWQVGLTDRIGDLSFLKELRYGEGLLPENLTNDLDNLEIFVFDTGSLNNGLLPDWVFNSNKLIELSITDSALQIIPEDISNLVNLVTLNVKDNNSLESIPEIISTFTTFTNLNITSTNITSIQNVICERIDSNNGQLIKDADAICE